MLLTTFSGTAVLLGLSALGILVIASIFLLKFVVRRQRATESTQSVDHKQVYRYRESIHGFALCVAIAGSALAINWTSPAQDQTFSAITFDVDEILELTIPPTGTPPPPPPPPPPPVIEPVATELVEEPEPFQSLDIDPLELVAPPGPPLHKNLAPASAPTPAALPPPPEDYGNGDPILFVEHMPTFGTSCVELSGPARRACSDKALLSFIYEHIKYPALARENGIQGNVVLSFVVERDGSVSSIEALREVAGGCTNEAISALKAINEEGQRFTPGIQNMQPVRVKFTMPIQFKLQ
ncbi:energy transducer TonB [Neolewinella antarctica]|uniref:Protein TonB n=1 Tax=Neolewinella antarctica TaxID=442734 RepID=A0ABX0X8Z4_9BACT|nr:energy transducer TonB [Neolewinella antarctica]NJC25453.1 protein TonB [Neolewinella antarctica]